MLKPKSRRTPISTIIELPTANVTSLKFAERPSCTRPPTQATIDCQDRDDKNAPEMKKTTSPGELAMLVLRPRINVVKYAIVSGLSKVKPKTNP
jgi:hypothetical protein